MIEDADNNLFFCEMQFDTSVKPIRIRFNEPLSLETHGSVDKIIKIETYTKDANTLFALVLK